MPEWGIALIGIAGLIVGAIITEVRHWLDRQQRFQVMTFEKRLQTHQEALSCWYELYHALNIGTSDDKHKAIDKLEKWWENNLLFLDEVSRDKMLALIGEARDHITGHAESHSAVFRTLRETRDAIVRGIGAKYLPEMPEPKEEKT